MTDDSSTDPESGAEVIRDTAGRVVGALVRAGFSSFSELPPFDGFRGYVTPPELPLQMVVVTGPPGYRDSAHVHVPLEQADWSTRHTVGVCISGVVRVHLGDLSGVWVRSVDLHAGDALLYAASHQVELLTDGARLLEVKQGPYPGSTALDRRSMPDLAVGQNGTA